MLNSVALMGRMVRDPELKTTSNNTDVCSFTVAVERDFGDKVVDFIDCIAWKANAKFVCQYFKKGQMIAVIGSLQSRKWQDKNGNNRINWEVVVSNSYFAGNVNKDGGKSSSFYDMSEEEAGEIPF